MGGIYFHIPFCRHKCLYCNFFSVANTSQAGMVVAAMRRELAERRKAEEARGKKAFTPPMRQREVSKALRAYGKMVSSADKGGVRIVED